MRNIKRPKGSYLFLYAAYISTCLVDRAWSFCISLCMDALGGMRMVSIEQLAEGLIQIVLSGHLGKVFDEMSRRNAIITVIPFNNLSTALSACFFASLLISYASVLVTAWGLRIACVIIGSLSFFLMFCKAFCLRALYIRKPKLHFKQEAKIKEEGNPFIRQQVFAAGIGMALLFMTVMGFDGLAIGYGQSLGVPDYIMGGFRPTLCQPRRVYTVPLCCRYQKYRNAS
uniref:Solute carrier family 40 member n=1 Tax=Heterorhabditis bacteriophora TaxID=37862 RepID=A0A1I7WJ70_HETBA